MSSRSPPKPPHVYSFRRVSPIPLGGDRGSRSPVRTPPSAKPGPEKQPLKLVSEEPGPKQVSLSEYQSLPTTPGDTERSFKMPVRKIEAKDGPRTANFRKTPGKSPDILKQGVRAGLTPKLENRSDNRPVVSTKFMSRSPVNSKNHIADPTESKKQLLKSKGEVQSPLAHPSAKAGLARRPTDKLADKQKLAPAKPEDSPERVSDFLQGDIFGTETGASKAVIQGMVFKNEILEKINSDLSKPADEKLTKSEVLPSSKQGTANEPKAAQTLTDSRIMAQYISNKRPSPTKMPRMPLNDKGEYTTKLLQLQVPKAEPGKYMSNQRPLPRGSLDNKSREPSNDKPDRAGYQSEKSPERVSSMSAVHTKNFSPTRAANLAPKEDSSGLRVRKKTLKIDRVAVDKRITSVMDKLPDQKFDLPVSDVPLERIPSLLEPSLPSPSADIVKPFAKKVSINDPNTVKEIQVSPKAIAEQTRESPEKAVVRPEPRKDPSPQVPQEQKDSGLSKPKSADTERDKRLELPVPTDSALETKPAVQPAEPLQRSSRAVAKPRSTDVNRLGSKKEISEVFKTTNFESESRHNHKAFGDELSAPHHLRSTSTNIEGPPRWSKLTSPEFDLIRKMDNMPDKFPKLLNAFLKFDIAPAIHCIGYNSHQGYVRDYNEDRISVVFSDRLQQNPRVCRFFPEPPHSFGMYSIFDGHNGFECAEFLKNNLHNVLLDQAFGTHKDFESRIKRIYEDVEVMYKLYSIRNKKSFAGSCSTTLVQYNDKLLVINVGDSRIIMSAQSGFEVMELSVDHKPENPSEFKRIVGSGGFVYRSLWSWISKKGRDELVTRFEQIAAYETASRNERLLEIGPWRANAGGLSVSRTFGDFEAKYKELGGTPGVIVCEPEVFELDVRNGDFVVIGCELTRRRHLRQADQPGDR